LSCLKRLSLREKVIAGPSSVGIAQNGNEPFQRVLSTHGDVMREAVRDD